MNKDSKIKLNSGNVMPVMGLGTWQLENSEETVLNALDAGFRMIDTSSDYGSQPGIGKAIRKSGIPREDIFLITKVEENDDSYERTISNLEELELDYVDLMLIHRSPENSAGEELWKGLIRARNEGLTRDIGVSNYSSDKIDILIDVSGIVPAVNQIEWSPFGHSMEILEHCTRNGTVIMAYSPLTRGQRLGDPTIKELSEKYKKSTAQILIRWSIQVGTVPIPKANQKKHLEENVDVFDFNISDLDMELLSSLNEYYSTFDEPLPYVKKREQRKPPHFFHH